MPEYIQLMEAYQLRRADELNDLALSAWWHQQVKATKGSGKNMRPYFKHLSELFDHDAMVDEIRDAYEADYQPKSKTVNHQNQAQIIAKRMQEFQQMKAKHRRKEG